MTTSAEGGNLTRQNGCHGKNSGERIGHDSQQESAVESTEGISTGEGWLRSWMTRKDGEPPYGLCMLRS